MKRSQLKSLILEVALGVQNEVPQDETPTQPKSSVKDKLGKFFIVTKPQSNKPTREDIIVECTVERLFDQIAGGLTKEELLGVFKSKSEANALATEIIKDYTTRLKEIESELKDFRKTKSDLEAKQKSAKEKVLKLKG